MGITGIMAAMVAAQLKLAALQAQVAELDAMRETVELQQAEIDELEAREPETVYVERVVEVPVVQEVERVVERPAEFRECGMCGAHVTEWWWVTSDYDGELFEVCHDCKELVEEGL